MGARQQAAAIILAGGRSTRLGRDKASEVLLGRTLLQRAADCFRGLVDEYVIVSAREQRLPEVEAQGLLQTVEDIYPETGPLGGIITGIGAMESPFGLVVACDMPLLQPALLSELLRLAPGHDLVTPLHDGLPEPLCAVYTKACLEPIRSRLENGAYKVSGFYSDVHALYVSEEQWRAFDPAGLSFLNLNREEDIERAKGLLEAEEPC